MSLQKVPRPQQLRNYVIYHHDLHLSCARSKGVEISCEIDYAISFWSWILSWKYPHFVETSTFRGYYPYFMEISTFCGYYPHFVYVSIFCGNIHVPWILSAFCVCISISWRLSAFCGNVHVLWIFPALRAFYISHFTRLMKVTGESNIFLFIT